MEKNKLTKSMFNAFIVDKVVIYDIESYPNFFSLAYYIPSRDIKAVLEISPRQNDLKKMLFLLKNLQGFVYDKKLKDWVDTGEKWHMVGYNNSEYDWLVCDWIIENTDKLKYLDGETCAREINDFNNYWFNVLQKNRNKFFQYRKDNQLWQQSYKIPQIDLFKIHRLDAAKIGLKVIQFNMNFPSITTLPHEPGKVLSYQEMDEVKDYNLNNDVMGTYWFYKESIKAAEKEKDREIDFRKAMSSLLNKDLMASSDVKIAEVWFQQELERRGVICYEYVEGERVTSQTTYSDGFKLDDVIFDCIKFKTPVFNRLLKWFKTQHITDTKGAFTNLSNERLGELCEHINPNVKRSKKGEVKKLELMFDNVPFVLGQGGLHASIESSYVNTDSNYVLLDWDVKSYYPSIIAGVWKALGKELKVFPRHIGDVFCEIVKEVRDIRFKTPKSDPKNLMYKLILNAFTFGKLNEGNSFVLDPKTLLTVTANGQLMLCMLAEMLILATNDTHIIQANTDGITIKVNRKELNIAKSIFEEWQSITGLILEEAIYDWMAIDNVNNYLAKYSDDEVNEDPGKIKAKGKYLTKPTWTQDFSTLVIQKAVSAYFKDGTLPEKFIVENKNPFDFRARIKIDKRFKLYAFLETDDGDNNKISIVDRVAFNYIIKHKIDIVETLTKLNDNDEFRSYITEEIANSKKINFDDVQIKDINRRFKSIISRAKFLGEKLAPIYNLEERVTKLFAKWWLDNEKRLDLIPIKGKKLQPVTAYYMAKKGVYMFKYTVPTEDNPTIHRYTGIKAGELVMPCNDISKFNFDNVNYDWYINEAWKLITPIMPESDKHLSPIWQSEQETIRLKKQKEEERLAKLAERDRKKKEKEAKKLAKK